MIETIAMWGGFAGIIVAVFAVIILYLTRKNILDILEKDVILFDKNFELKKSAINTAMNLVDQVEKFGNDIVYRPDFSEKAKNCYNDLLCVVNNLTLAEDFRKLAINPEGLSSTAKIVEFKLACRRDIGLNLKHSKNVSMISSSNTTTNDTVETPSYNPPVQPAQPTQPVRPVQPRPAPRPMPARPVQPRPAPRPRPQGTPAGAPKGGSNSEEEF